MFMAIFGRTDLRKSLSRAKFDEESDFEVRLAVAPQKPRQIREKRNFETEKFRKFFSHVEKVSALVEKVSARAKTSKNFAKTREKVYSPVPRQRRIK